MKFINNEIDENIESIIFYYDRKNKIKQLKEKMTEKYNQINNLHNQIKEIEKNLEEEMNGKFETAYTFKLVNGKNDFVEESIKTKNGRLEHLTEFLEESTEKQAIDKYMRSVGVKLYGGEISEYSKIANYIP